MNCDYACRNASHLVARRTFLGQLVGGLGATALGLGSSLPHSLAQGLHQAIALGLDLKFGEAGSALLPEISDISDPVRLQSIIARIKTAQSPAEVRAVYRPWLRRKSRTARTSTPETE